MKITAFHRFLWSAGHTVFYAIVLMLPIGGWWFIDMPAKLAFAWWFVSAYRQTQQKFEAWREEKLHEHIRPVLTGPPEIDR